MFDWLKGFVIGMALTSVVVLAVIISVLLFIWLLWDRQEEPVPQSDYIVVVLYETAKSNPSVSNPKNKLFIPVRREKIFVKK